MNTIYILGIPIWDKTQLEFEAYTLLSFLLLWNGKHKERGTHYGVSFLLWHLSMLKNVSSSVIIPKYHYYILFSTLYQERQKVTQPFLLLLAPYLT
jgi:hypothetical protein